MEDGRDGHHAGENGVAAQHDVVLVGEERNGPWEEEGSCDVDGHLEEVCGSHLDNPWSEGEDDEARADGQIGVFDDLAGHSDHRNVRRAPGEDTCSLSWSVDCSESLLCSWGI